jgi:hypothetical protein
MHNLISTTELARLLDVSTKLISVLTGDVFEPFAASEKGEKFFLASDLQKLHG